MTGDALNKKTVYFATRTISSLEAWKSRWRQHASLGMSQEFWELITKYSQCDVIHDTPFGTGEAIDGVGLCWQTPGKASGINGMKSDPEGMRQMVEDEKEVFGIYVGDISVISVETVLKEGHGAAFKIFLRLYSRSDAFRDVLDKFGEAILACPALAPLIRRLSVGWIEPDEYTRNSRFDFNGLIELSVDDLDAARKTLESRELRELADTFAEAIQVDWRMLVVRENMFWDPETGIDERARLVREYPPVFH